MPPTRSYGPYLFLGAGGVVNDVIGQRFIMVPRRQTVETGNTNIWVSNTGRELCTLRKNNTSSRVLKRVNIRVGVFVKQLANFESFLSAD